MKLPSTCTHANRSQLCRLPTRSLPITWQLLCAATIAGFAPCSGARSDVQHADATIPQRLLVQTGLLKRRSAARNTMEALPGESPGAAPPVPLPPPGMSQDDTQADHSWQTIGIAPSPSGPGSDWNQFQNSEEERLATAEEDEDIAIEKEQEDYTPQQLETARIQDSTPPTQYVHSSCMQMPLDAIASYASPLGMSVNKCFHHCERRPGNKFFGMTRGHECFCSPLPLGRIVSGDRCDIKCAGAPAEFCGGVSNIASTYTMINCMPPTPEEEKRAAAKKKAKLVASYQIREGESCGQSKDNRVELDGSAVMPGEPQDCAVACWQARGAEYCSGFTYDAMMEKCTFHADVVDGETIKKKGLKCYFKKLNGLVDL